MDTSGGHVGWQIKSIKKTKIQTTKGETQILQPDMRFAIQQRNKAKANGEGPNKNNHNQDLPWTQR